MVEQCKCYSAVPPFACFCLQVSLDVTNVVATLTMRVLLLQAEAANAAATYYKRTALTQQELNFLNLLSYICN